MSLLTCAVDDKYNPAVFIPVADSLNMYRRGECEMVLTASFIQ